MTDTVTADAALGRIEYLRLARLAGVHDRWCVADLEDRPCPLPRSPWLDVEAASIALDIATTPGRRLGLERRPNDTARQR